MSSILDTHERHITITLPGGQAVQLARMGVRRWRKLAQKLREERLNDELRAISGKRIDPVLEQTLRLRAQAFEPSYYDLVDSALTPTGIERLLPFAAIEAGTDPELAAELVDILPPALIQRAMAEITHAPLGPKLGGDLREGQAQPYERRVVARDERRKRAKLWKRQPLDVDWRGLRWWLLEHYRVDLDDLTFAEAFDAIRHKLPPKDEEPPPKPLLLD